MLPCDPTSLTRGYVTAKPSREIGMKHANVAANQAQQRSYGSPAAQRSWQAIRAARRQGDVPDSQRIARFNGDSATTAVGEAVLTYGKAKPNEWDFDATLGTRPPAPSRVERKDKRESGKWVLDWTPKVAGDCYPEAKLPAKLVAVSQGNRVARRFRVDSVDRVTGEDTSILVTLVTNEIHILCYGKHFVFSKSNRSKGTFLDNRDGKRKPLSFAKSELCRMLGVTEGMAKYAELVALPPKRPEASSTDAAQQGSKATLPSFDEQGIRLPVAA